MLKPLHRLCFGIVFVFCSLACYCAFKFLYYRISNDSEMIDKKYHEISLRMTCVTYTCDIIRICVKVGLSRF